MSTEEFRILNKYLGWGDPCQGIWFLGVDDGINWCDPAQNISELGSEPFSISDQPPCDGNGLPYPVTAPSSKIAISVSYRYQNDDKSWRLYRDHYLWRPGSKTCNANLYPLGRHSLREPFPPCYEQLFGVRSPNDLEYRKRLRRVRFNIFRECVKKYQPKVIICYGKEYWKEFKELFDLPSVPDKLLRDKSSSEAYESSRVILTRHFSNGMPDATIDRICKEIKDWGVQIP